MHTVEPPKLRRDADLEARAPGRARHHGLDAGGFPHSRGEHTAVERRETGAAPPQTGEEQGEREAGEAAGADEGDARTGGSDRERRHEWSAGTHDVRERESEAQRGREYVLVHIDLRTASDDRLLIDYRDTVILAYKGKDDAGVKS